MTPAAVELPVPRQRLRNHIGGERIDDALDAQVRSVYFAVSMVYSIERGILDHPTRGRSRVAFARQVAMYLAHTHLGLPLTAAGGLFRRDRTTARHACRQVEERRDDPRVDSLLEHLERGIDIAVDIARLSARGSTHG